MLTYLARAGEELAGTGAVVSILLLDDKGLLRKRRVAGVAEGLYGGD